LSFKLYTQNVVILGNFSVSRGTISFLVGGNSIGTIAGVTVSGTSLSATFNINGYCVAVQVAQKNTVHSPTKTYVPDDNFEQYLIDAGSFGNSIKWGPDSIHWPSKLTKIYITPKYKQLITIFNTIFFHLFL